jgi:YfiH family protein
MILHTCPYFSQFSALKHGFFEADPDILLTHRNQAMEMMADHPLPLATLKQVHGNRVVEVTEVWKKEVEGDGMVTNIRGLALGILTADCGPVLFYDPKAQIIGACHAGWRGAKGGILQATVSAMEKLGATRLNIYAALGPTIQQNNYEVGPEFPDLINEPYENFFSPSDKSGHHYFDLPHYICHQLHKEDIFSIKDIKRNTFTGNFSSRRRFLSESCYEIRSDNLSAIAII